MSKLLARSCALLLSGVARRPTVATPKTWLAPAEPKDPPALPNLLLGLDGRASRPLGRAGLSVGEAVIGGAIIPPSRRGPQQSCGDPISFISAAARPRQKVLDKHWSELQRKKNGQAGFAAGPPPTSLQAGSRQIVFPPLGRAGCVLLALLRVADSVVLSEAAPSGKKTCAPASS